MTPQMERHQMGDFRGVAELRTRDGRPRRIASTVLHRMDLIDPGLIREGDLEGTMAEAITAHDPNLTPETASMEVELAAEAERVAQANPELFRRAA